MRSALAPHWPCEPPRTPTQGLHNWVRSTPPVTDVPWPCTALLIHCPVRACTAPRHLAKFFQNHETVESRWMADPQEASLHHSPPEWPGQSNQRPHQTRLWDPVAQSPGSTWVTPLNGLASRQLCVLLPAQPISAHHRHAPQLAFASPNLQNSKTATACPRLPNGS